MALPYRAEHVGSLLRPKELTTAFRKLNAGEIDAAAYGEIVDSAITDIIRMQERVGLRSITDGEYRRASYWAHFVEKTDGLDVKPAIYHFHDDCGHEQEFLAPHVTGKVKRTRPISGDEFDFLNARTKGTAKITMPSPPTMHFWRGAQGIEAAAYQDREEFFADLAEVYRAEINDLAARGATYLQIDEVPLAMLCDPAIRERVKADGDDPEALAKRYVRLINECVGQRPDGVTMGMHLCRGNYKGQWLSEGGYDSVAELLFNEVAVDAFFLEFDSARAGGFAPLRHLPKGKFAVLGLVSSKTGDMENEDDLKRRIDEAAEECSLDQLALSPQCGFSSTVAGNPLTMDAQERKLEMIVRIADDVWG